MLEWLVRTDGDLVPLVLRLTLTVVMFAHGAQKALGWFGHRFERDPRFPPEVGVPSPIAALAIMAELLGPLGLAVGLLTRVAALGIAAVMLGAILTVHRRYGFFMNWYGNEQGEGFEYHVLAIGLAVALVLNGAGMWSVDAMIAGH